MLLTEALLVAASKEISMEERKSRTFGDILGKWEQRRGAASEVKGLF